MKNCVAEKINLFLGDFMEIRNIADLPEAKVKTLHGNIALLGA